MALSVHVIKCANAPTSAPTDVGQHWVTDGGELFFSVGTSSVSDWIQVDFVPQCYTANIAASANADVVSLSFATYKATKYFVSVHSTANNVYRSFEVLATRKGAAGIEDTVYATVGDIINLSTVVNVSGGDVNLNITNNEAFAVDVIVKTIPLT